MKRQQLVAIIRPRDRLPQGLHAVVAADLAAVYAPQFRIGRLTRRGVLRAAARRQRYLEELLPEGTVLPVLPGQTLPVTEAARMLRANAPLLGRKIADLSGKLQFQITLAIDETRALDRFATPVGPFAPVRDMARLHDMLAAHLRDRLGAISSDVIMLPVADALVANAVLLVDGIAEAALHEMIAEFDAHWPEGFRFRMIGPSPAVSFASVSFQKTDAREIARALEILDLPSPCDPAAIATARAAALRGARAPAEQVRMAAEIAKSAGRLAGEAAPSFHRVRFWAEGMAATAPLTLREAA
ncbi:MAG: GvpL/GvpF family gas vesicle protein [Roseicyclus sp.]